MQNLARRVQVQERVQVRARADWALSQAAEQMAALATLQQNYGYQIRMAQRLDLTVRLLAARERLLAAREPQLAARRHLGTSCVCNWHSEPAVHLRQWQHQERRIACGKRDKQVT